MSLNSPRARRRTRRPASPISPTLWLILLSLPGAVVLVLLLWYALGATVVIGAAVVVSAIITLICVSCLAGRCAAAVYNFFRYHAARAGLEKIVHHNQSHGLPPQSPA